MYSGLGLDFETLYAKGLDFMLQQAANWARIPTRLNRVEAARAIVEQAALQRQDRTTLATMQATLGAIRQVRGWYDAGSEKVAGVVDEYRALPAGAVPSLGMVTRAADAAGIIGRTTTALTTIEQQVAESARKTLTPEQAAQLNSGLSFTGFMGAQAKTLLRYAVLSGALYLGYRALKRSGGTRSW